MNFARSFAVALIALAALVLPGAGRAQAFPDRPVRLVIGFPTGTSVDIVGRLIGQKLGELWAQPVVVLNRTGAGGNIAADQVAKSTPDGYTLLLCNTGIATSATLYKKLPYDAMRDLEPVALVSSLPFALIVNAALPAATLRDFIALAKAQPGVLNFASAGVGNADHLAGELFRFNARVNMVHVPYKGGTEALTDVISGRVAMYFSGVTAALPLVKSGQVRALATSGPRRAPIMPDVPTMAEAGLPQFEVTLWNGLLAPAGTPKQIVATVAEDTRRVLNLPDVQARFAALGLEAGATTPAEFGAFLGAEIGKWAEVIRSIGLTLEQ